MSKDHEQYHARVEKNEETLDEFGHFDDDWMRSRHVRLCCCFDTSRLSLLWCKLLLALNTHIEEAKSVLLMRATRNVRAWIPLVYCIHV